MNAFPENQTDTQRFQRNLAPFKSVKLGSRRFRYDGAENPYRATPPGKLDPILEHPSPATSAKSKALPKARTIGHKTWLAIAFFCLLATSLSLAKLTMLLHSMDEKPVHVRVSEQLKDVPKERREPGGTIWWKVAMSKAKADDDPDVRTSTTGPEKDVPRWWSEEDEVLAHLLV
ncbi:hypothetical protein FRC01_006783 [Tulasnella sp. 417]|nr:hypothetical protein FRC01_006783 [Tulasnella sp. 417]